MNTRAWRDQFRVQLWSGFYETTWADYQWCISLRNSRTFASRGVQKSHQRPLRRVSLWVSISGCLTRPRSERPRVIRVPLPGYSSQLAARSPSGAGRVGGACSRFSGHAGATRWDARRAGVSGGGGGRSHRAAGRRRRAVLDDCGRRRRARRRGDHVDRLRGADPERAPGGGHAGVGAGRAVVATGQRGMLRRRPGLHRHIDIHLHVDEGPADGASAGVAMAAALVSALAGRVVRGDGWMGSWTRTSASPAWGGDHDVGHVVVADAARSTIATWAGLLPIQ